MKSFLMISLKIKSSIKSILVLFLVVVILSPIKISAETVEVSLSNCVDTESARFILNVNEIKVRFIGIQKVLIDDELIDVDKYVCEKLEKAQKIEIEYEPLEKENDTFGRISVWVFIDGSLLQEDLIKNGYAKILSLNDEYLYAEKLKESQKYARENKIGVWKKENTEKLPIENENEKEEVKENKSIFRIILDFFKDIFNKIREFIDNLINNILS